MKHIYCSLHPNRKMAHSGDQYICFECLNKEIHQNQIKSGNIKMNLKYNLKQAVAFKSSKAYKNLYSRK
jgi:hypothetical protein